MTDKQSNNLLKARSVLDESYGRLNGAWDDINEELREMKLPIKSYFTLPDDPADPDAESVLGWERKGGSWQVVYFTCYGGWDPGVVGLPIAELSAEKRLSLIKVVSSLASSMIDSAMKFSETVAEATSQPII